MERQMSFPARDMRGFLGALAACAGLLLLVAAGPAQAASCGGRHATIVGTAGNDVIVGKKASDVIYGGGGDDRITGGPNGNDRICGGPGDDSVVGGKGYDVLFGDGGNDRLDGESGADRLSGGGGDDELQGAEGNDGLDGDGGDDHLLGAKGPDRLNGGGGDDRVFGDKGNDLLEGGDDDDLVEGGAGDDVRVAGGGGRDQAFGGTGIDDVDGGAGDGDVVRGDSGIDKLDGGPGSLDIVSYASATRGGVIVSLASGNAKGDGHDSLSGFEDVVGSPEGDQISGDGGVNRLDGGVGNDSLDGGGGSDEAFGGAGTDGCSGFAVEHSCGAEENPPGSGTLVILNQGLDGASLIVQGNAEDNGIRVAYGNGAWSVSDGSGVAAGEGCGGGGTAVTCPTAIATSLVVITGGPGNDGIDLDGALPGSVRVRANGNAGSDSLSGGPGDDVLEAGENYNGPDNGNDTLVGNAGADVLYADPGADQLSGGAGNDLLVSSVATCQGHDYDGGAGDDTVSYGRSDANMRVELGGTGEPGGCGQPDQVRADNESLEGSKGPDVLIGDNGENSFYGHVGADVFMGKGGSDFIDAADGQRDAAIICGGGDDEISVDRADPDPTGC